MKNLANYPDPDNIGSTHWFKFITNKLDYMGFALKEGLLTTTEEIKTFAIKMLAVNADLIEWQETGNPLFDIEAKDTQVGFSGEGETDGLISNQHSYIHVKGSTETPSLHKLHIRPSSTEYGISSLGEGEFFGVNDKSPYPEAQGSIMFNANGKPYTCTEAKGNNSTFHIHKPGNPF